MRFGKFYPTKGFFLPGEMIRFFASIEIDSPAAAVVHLHIFHLAQIIDTLTYTVSSSEDGHNLTIEWQGPPAAPRGYGAKAELSDPTGAVVDTISTAFDVLPDWTAFPRYGFLTDFTPNRADIADTLDELAQFHINGLQFYDWQYRHDTLLPPDSEYVDPLGRSLSLKTVGEFIEAAHNQGMAAMAYLAVYAASVAFWRAHPEWALYDADGRPHTFDDFLGLMDPSPGGPWIEHITHECGDVLAQLPFDGLHVDQYGHPKEGFTVKGDPVDIPAAFTSFIRTLKSNQPHAAVVFNAVGNWPIEALAATPQDFVYIEIWPPDVYYRDIRRIVASARAMSGGKPVVIALYLPVSQPENVCLADALIFSLGGARIELGEGAQLLADPYFPKHQTPSADLKERLHRYYDFVVRYGDFLGPSADLLEEFEAAAPPGVWTVLRSCPGWFVLVLINMSGLEDPRWDEVQPAPTPLAAVSLRINLAQSFQAVWWASPDLDDPSLTPLPWTLAGERVSVTLPELNYWAMIAFELETTERNSDD